MSKINKAGLIVIFITLMLDSITGIVGLREGQEGFLVMVNGIMFFTGSIMVFIE